MAEEIIFKVGVDTGNSVSDLGKVEQGISDIDKAAKGVNTDVAAKFDDLNKRVASGNMTFREMNKAIKEYASIALQAGLETPIGKEAIANAAQLKDDLRGLGEEISRAKDGAAGMQAVLQLGSGIAAGYGAVQGTMALLGTESEALEQSMQKLIAVQTVLNSIETIRAALEKESFLVIKAKSAGTAILTAAQTAYTAAVGGTTGAMAALRVAMLAIPIVALIAGITALVAAIAGLLSEEEKAEEMNNRVTRSYDRMTAAAERSAAKRRQASQNAIEIAQLEGRSIEEIHTLERDNIIQTEKERREAIYREKVAIQQRKEAYKQALDEGNEDLARSIKDEINQHRKKYSDLTAQNGQYLHELRVADLELKKEQEEREKELTEQRKRAAEERKRIREQEARERKEEYDRFVQEQKQLIQDIGEIETPDFSKPILPDPIEFEQQANEIVDISEETFGIDGTLWKIQKNWSDNFKDTFDRTTSFAAQGLGAIQDLTDAFAGKSEASQRKAFNIRKAASIAQTSIETFKAAQSAYASQIIPGDPSSPVRGAIAAAIATATGVANIAKIARQQFQSSGGGASAASVSAPSTGTPPVPVPEPTTTLTAGLPGANSAVGNKVFVVDSEITQQQQMSGKVQALATFGG